MNNLAGHKTYLKLFKYTLPMISMMIIINVYSIVDGIFVSNVVGETAFEGLNFIMPIIMIIGAIGFMIGTGGQALIGKTLGEGDQDRANAIFSMLVLFVAIVGTLFAFIAEFFIDDIAYALGARDSLLESAVEYGRVLMGFIPILMLQYSFQSFMIIAGRRKMALIVTIISGITNMICDFLFVFVFKFGLTGAATATGMCWSVGMLIPLIYFIRKNSSMLQLKLKKLEWKVIQKTCYNGLSELLTNISFSIANMLFNAQLLRIMGEKGNDCVFAYGVIMYLSFIFNGVYMGFAGGVSSLVSYNYGANDKEELSSLIRKGTIILSLYSIALTVIAILSARGLSHIFIRDNKELLDFSAHTMRIYSFSFLICGFNIFTSAFFTGLNNGTISAIVSITRSLIIQIIMIYLLPFIFGKDAIWYSVIVSEFLCLIESGIFVIIFGKKYGYTIFHKRKYE